MSSGRSPRSGPQGAVGLRVVVDTNVWVSGLILPDSLPGQVLEAVRDGRIEPVMSWELAEELVEVLSRPRIRRYGVSADDIGALMAGLRPFLPTVELAVEVRGPDDAPVIAAAVAGRAEAIVTGDRDLLDDPALAEWLADRGVALVRPPDLLSRVA